MRTSTILLSALCLLFVSLSITSVSAYNETCMMGCYTGYGRCWTLACPFACFVDEVSSYCNPNTPGSCRYQCQITKLNCENMCTRLYGNALPANPEALNSTTAKTSGGTTPTTDSPCTTCQVAAVTPQPPVAEIEECPTCDYGSLGKPTTPVAEVAVTPSVASTEECPTCGYGSLGKPAATTEASPVVSVAATESIPLETTSTRVDGLPSWAPTSPTFVPRVDACPTCVNEKQECPTCGYGKSALEGFTLTQCTQLCHQYGAGCESFCSLTDPSCLTQCSKNADACALRCIPVLVEKNAN